MIHLYDYVIPPSFFYNIQTNGRDIYSPFST